MRRRWLTLTAIPVFIVDPANADILLAGRMKRSVKVFVSSRLAPSKLVMLDDILSSGLLGDCGDVERRQYVG